MRKLVIALLVVACGGPKEPTAPGVSSVVPTSKSTPAGSSAAVAPGSAPVPSGTASAKNSGHAAAISSGDAGKKGRLSVGEARRYMVTLINRDRATAGLAPVELDEGPPTRSGQGHAEDMASHGYLGHWGSDGSVPEQRLTEAGGSDMVLENALCFIDEVARKLDKAPTFERQEIERAEGMFFNEVPPNDGHRKNILKPAHKRVGIGIAQPIATPTELPVPCFAQEFTDPYGTYAAVPTRMKVGETHGQRRELRL